MKYETLKTYNSFSTSQTGP